MLFRKPSSSSQFTFPIFSLCVFVLLSLSCVTKQNVYDISAFKAKDRPWVIAHRGGRALFPENTMTAFDGSAKMQVDALEMDVCITKDGILVTNHDLTIDRTSNGKGAVSDYTFEDLQQFNFGHHFKNDNEQLIYRKKDIKIPTFESVLKKYGSEIPLIIELKNKSQNGFLAAKKMVELLEKYQLKDKVIIASFNDDVLKHFKKLCNNKFLTATSIKESKAFVMSRKLGMPFLFRPVDAAVQFPMKAKGMNLSRNGMIKAAKKRNMLIHYWTINTEENMKKLIKFGVDGIMTDRPDLLIDLFEKLDNHTN